MKVSLNWLNDFVDLKGINIKDIVSRFSLTTAEIEGYEEKGAWVTPDIVVAEIKTVNKIEGSKKLSKLTVFDGTKNHQVVCGAPNVRVGLKVVFAPAGICVGELKLERVKIAGVESQGMCLSARELGISNDHDGIIELGDTAKIGEPIIKIMPFIKDTIIEVDNKSITNRPDLWGHHGIARELATIFDLKLKDIQGENLETFSKLPAVPIKIENDLCYSYGAIRVEGVTRKETPIEMQTRLFHLDINSHGFLVDLSNFIMLELGQPNHAFDARKVGSISVGQITGGTFTTLKDQQVKTTKDMLFIKSDGKAVGLAGIIGGKNSEIDETTKDCVFEFATFDPTNIRKTSTAIGIRTDASARFEKSLDTNLNKVAAERMVYLLKKYDAKASVASKFTFASTVETKPIKLQLEVAYVEKFCSIKFDWKKVSGKLAKLGFQPEINGGVLHVITPTWRATKDITTPVDVIEEIVRTYGYDNIMPIAPRAVVTPVNQPDIKLLANRIKEILAFVHRCQEVHTYIWSETPSDLKVVNSCVSGCDYIRESIAPSLLAVAEKNKLNFENIRIFEIGSIVRNGRECRHLGICIPDYKELADIIRDIFKVKFLIGKGREKFNENFLHPKSCASIIMANQNIGYIGKVVGKDCAIAEINLDMIDSQVILGNKNFTAPSKYQKNRLDFTFNWDGEYGYIQEVFEKFKHPLNMGFRLKDIYNKSYTLEFTVGSYEKTLTAADINDIWSKIIEFGKKNNLTLKQ